MPGEKLDVLLVEDNPGDARLIEELLRDGEELLSRVELDGTAVDGATLHHEERLEGALERLAEAPADVDVVLLDLGLPESTGLDTLQTVLDETTFVPVVVLTGLRDEQAGLEAIQRGAQDYLVKDEVTPDLLVRTVHHAIERNRQEREQARRREQLEALNRLNQVAQDVTHAVITTDRREALEQAVCDRLVDADAYRFAWIGGVDRGVDRVVPRVAAGVEEGYLDDVDIAVAEGPTSEGPTGTAVRTKEVQVVQDVRSDPGFEPWREQARERGYRGSAAVPIIHEELVYGVLSVYATSADAFSEPEVEILSRLGDVIGHAIAAIERRDALTSDQVLQFEFDLDGVAEELVDLSTDGATVSFENLVSSGDGVLAYGRAEGLDGDTFQEAVARTDLAEDLRLLSSNGDAHAFELVTTGVGPLVEAVSTHGGRVVSATVDGGGFRLVVEFPPGRDKRRLVELVRDHCPGATPVAQRTTEPSDASLRDPNAVLQEELTDRQRTVLETSYFAGYFDWPRTSTGEELAERLDISPSTFTQHLRAAERRFFDAVFEDGRADERE